MMNARVSKVKYLTCEQSELSGHFIASLCEEVYCTFNVSKNRNNST